MKSTILVLLMSLSSCASIDNGIAYKEENMTRSPASTVEVQRLLEIDQRRGCCSHHGGVSHCSSGNLFCNDGWISGCGC